MAKTLFVASTVFILFWFMYLLPSFGYSDKIFVTKFNATEREKLIIYEVYDKLSVTTKISSWIIIGNYILFAGAMYCIRYKRK